MKSKPNTINQGKLTPPGLPGSDRSSLGGGTGGRRGPACENLEFVV